MADCIWMETALIASSLAEHRDIACSWVRKQGAIERDLSNETTYQELVEELQLRPLEARRLAAFFGPEVAEAKQQLEEVRKGDAPPDGFSATEAKLIFDLFVPNETL